LPGGPYACASLSCTTLGTGAEPLLHGQAYVQACKHPCMRPHTQASPHICTLSGSMCRCFSRKTRRRAGCAHSGMGLRARRMVKSSSSSSSSLSPSLHSPGRWPQSRGVFATLIALVSEQACTYSARVQNSAHEETCSQASLSSCKHCPVAGLLPQQKGDTPRTQHTRRQEALRGAGGRRTCVRTSPSPPVAGTGTEAQTHAHKHSHTHANTHL